MVRVGQATLPRTPGAMPRVTRARLDELLGAAMQVEVLVVGDLMLDRYVTGTVQRISPEAPVPVVRVEQTGETIGGAGNVAANVAALGAKAHVVGCVGQDGAGDLLLDLFSEVGVDASGVIRTSGRRTTEKTRVLALRQQIVRFDSEVEDDVPADVAAALLQSAESLVARVDVLVLEDYDKGVLTGPVIKALLRAAEARGLPTVADPKRRHFFSYEGATVFKPNAQELEDALGDEVRAEDAAWMEETRLRLGCANLLLTLGEGGVALQTDGGDALRVPAMARDVFDVSGAGDTVTAVVATILAAGGSMAEAAVLANQAAAIEVGKAGVSTVTPRELLRHLED